jgi:hypothetical protein
MSRLAAADRNHDFDAITSKKPECSVVRPRNDFPIALDGNALSSQVKVEQQLGDCRHGGVSASGSVYVQLGLGKGCSVTHDTKS